MRFPIALIFTASFVTAAIAIPGAAHADSCEIDAEGSGSCYFACRTSTSIEASISSPFLQWRTIDGKAYCSNQLMASCAGHGECHHTGGGIPATSGSCIVRTGMGVDFTAACTSNGPNTDAVVNILRALGATTASRCNGSTCVDVPVVCVENLDVACAVGMTEARIREIHPDL